MLKLMQPMGQIDHGRSQSRRSHHGELDLGIERQPTSKFDRQAQKPPARLIDAAMHIGGGGFIGGLIDHQYRRLPQRMPR